MQRTSTDITAFTTLLRRNEVTLDQHLPEWARRSNPIVRRHLGVFWKMMPMEIGPLVRIVGLQVGALLLSFPTPFVFELSMLLMFTLIPVSISLMPLTLIFYSRVIFEIGYFGLKSIVDEIRNGTLQLLLTTPFTLPEIIASKVSAGVWRQVENLGIIIMTTSLLSMPLIAMQFSPAFPMDEQPYVLRLLLLTTYIASLLRMILEPFMVGMIGVMIGSVIPSRTPAGIALILLLFFYFLLINLPRLIPAPWFIRFLIEAVLPLTLPLLIIYFAFRVTVHILSPE